MEHAENVTITEAEDESRNCYKITTPAAVYFLDRAAGGFTSILDPGGNDWIGFHPEPSGTSHGAAGVYRGLPNMVHGQDPEFDGCGHPGFDVADCKAEGNSIRCSARGVWEWTWSFFDTHAVMDLTRVPPGKKYWILYEGPPGGAIAFDDLSPNFWGNNVDGRRDDSPKDKVLGNWNWVYFGHQKSSRVFWLKRQTPVACDDFMWYMDARINNDGMVVFGFGRNGLESQMSEPNRFSIGFLETADHTRIAQRLS